MALKSKTSQFNQFRDQYSEKYLHMMFMKDEKIDKANTSAQEPNYYPRQDGEGIKDMEIFKPFLTSPL